MAIARCAPASSRELTISPNIKTILARIQAKAQVHLSSAIASERARRWTEAIDHYRKLLRSLMKDKLPMTFIPGPDYTLLLLETYYHIGVAFQKLDLHHKALEEFTNAMEASHIPKYACQVGCVSKSFYHTPVFARRAYANVKCGKIKEAIYDANKAVTLDSSNPDVYCIRALVWSSATEKRRALVDLNYSFKLNPSHICTLIIRGAIISSLGAVSSTDRNKDHEKAYKLSQDSRQFFDVLNFFSPKMPSFYDRFLWSLNAFHTIMKINLFEGAVFAVTSEYRRSSSKREIDRQSYDSQTRLRGPFRCGAMSTYSDNTALLRRKVYSKLLMESNIGLNEKVSQRRKSSGQEAVKSGNTQEGLYQKFFENSMSTVYGIDDSKTSRTSFKMV